MSPGEVVLHFFEGFFIGYGVFSFIFDLLVRWWE